MCCEGCILVCSKSFATTSEIMVILCTKFGYYHNFTASTNLSPTWLDSKNGTLAHNCGCLPNKNTNHFLWNIFIYFHYKKSSCKTLARSKPFTRRYIGSCFPVKAGWICTVESAPIGQT